MPRRSFLAALLLVGGCVGLLAALGNGNEADSAARRTVPGLAPDGYVQLPNQWRLRPVGAQTEVGDFPVHAELHPSGQWLAVLHAGHGEHEIVVMALSGARARMTSRFRIDQTFYGLAFSADGNRLYASGGEYEVVHQFDFEQGMLRIRGRSRLRHRRRSSFPAGWRSMPPARRCSSVALSAMHSCVCRSIAGRQDRIALSAKPSSGAKPKEAFPFTCLPTPDGARLFVSLWNRAAVAVIDLESNKVTAEWPTEAHSNRDAAIARWQEAVCCLRQFDES